MYERYCVLHGFSKSRSFFVKSLVFQQNFDCEGLGEKREQTDTLTHALIVWWVGGEKELFRGFG